MHEKGVAAHFKYIHVDLGKDKPAWFKAEVNPYGTVPCIYDGDRGVFESAVSMEYIDEKFPQPDGFQLYPGDAVTRAAVRAFVSTLDFKAIYGYIMEQDRSKDAAHATACDALMASIETKFAAGSPSGPFFLGADLSAADIALFPFIDRMAPGLRAYRGYDLWGGGAYPRLLAGWAAIQARPAWLATHQPEDFYIAAYHGYATGKPGTVPKRVKAAV